MCSPLNGVWLFLFLVFLPTPPPFESARDFGYGKSHTRFYAKNILIHDVLVAFRSARQPENCGRVYALKKGSKFEFNRNGIFSIYFADLFGGCCCCSHSSCLCFPLPWIFRSYVCILWTRCIWTESIHEYTWHNIHSKFTARKIFSLNFKVSYSSSFGWDEAGAYIIIPALWSDCLLFCGVIQALYDNFMDAMENNTRK